MAMSRRVTIQRPEGRLGVELTTVELVGESPVIYISKVGEVLSQAGIDLGDIVEGIAIGDGGDVLVTHGDHACELLRNCAAGEMVQVVFHRGGQRLSRLRPPDLAALQEVQSKASRATSPRGERMSGHGECSHGNTPATQLSPRVRRSRSSQSIRFKAARVAPS